MKERVAAMTRGGMTAAEIAAALRVSTRTVHRCRRAAGISQPPPKPLSDDEKRLALSLLEDGCSYNEVARTLGRSVDCVLRNFPGFGWDRAQINEFLSIVRAS